MYQYRRQILVASQSNGGSAQTSVQMETRQWKSELRYDKQKALMEGIFPNQPGQ